MEKAEAEVIEAKAKVQKWEDKLEEDDASQDQRARWEKRLAEALAYRDKLEQHLQELRMALVASAPAQQHGLFGIRVYVRSLSFRCFEMWFLLRLFVGFSHTLDDAI